MLNGLDLFAGIGGISLALQPWVRTVCYVEIDRYCQGVLRSRIGSGDLEDAPIWDDVTTFDGKPWRGSVDIISGGFPCQDISVAGKGAGLEGERSGLFFEIIRIADIFRPQYIFMENVPVISSRGGLEVAGSLASIGYDARWDNLSAADVGAPHKRERWWCLARRIAENKGISLSPNAHGIGSYSQEAHQDGQGSSVQPGNEQECEPGSLCGDVAHPQHQCRSQSEYTQPIGEGISDSFIGCSTDVSHGNEQGLEVRQGQPENDGEKRQAPFGSDWWQSEPDVGRVANGVPMRVDRLKGLGNSVVPATAREAFTRLMGVIKC